MGRAERQWVRDKEAKRNGGATDEPAARRTQSMRLPARRPEDNQPAPRQLPPAWTIDRLDENAQEENAQEEGPEDGANA